MSLVHYKPVNLFRQFDNELNRYFSNAHTEAANQAHDWTPAVDIREEDNRYVVEADIPGVARENIDILLEDSVLTVNGQRSIESEDNAENYRRRERTHGSFVRQFTLPDTVNTEAISATVTDGVLEIRIPKQEKPEARKITVE
ncbi:MAG: Hsp20/alpha crystallin family protein [Gammaproteobacteria bacterium]